MKKPKYLPFAHGQWRLAMGLKPLTLDTWIDIDETFVDQLSLKAHLLSHRHSDVFGSLPDSEVGQQEVLELLLKHLPTYFPEHYQWQGEDLYNRITGQRWCVADFAANPLDLAGRLVQEDLCLMLPQDVGYRLAAGSVCFPSRWRLQEKLGHQMGQIHHPVPGYADTLERPVDQVLDRLKLDCPVYRFNWGIVDAPDLFLEPGQNPTAVDGIMPNAVAERLWLRVERQTLRRLNGGGILFTIRTYVDPLSSLADDPAMMHDLALAIEKIPTAMQSYKNLLPIQDSLLKYLNQQ